jgi:hypothetical protein
LKRYFAATCVAVGALAFGASTAVAGPGNGPPFGWPHHGPDDQITVTTEPPGENCEAGGLKVVVEREGRKRPPFEPGPFLNQIPEGAVPESEDPGVVAPVVKEPEEPKDPKPDFVPRPKPVPETFYVCNGLPGQDGPIGPIGPIGPAGPAGPSVTVPVQPKVCQSSTRIGVRLFLPSRLARFGVVRLAIAKVNGPLRFNQNVRVRVSRSNPTGQRFVFVPIRNRNCGSYLVTVGRGSIEPVVQIWQITGRFGLKRTTLTG